MTAKMRATIGAAVAVLTLSIALSAQAETGLARHKKMYAVPTPGKVVVDGKLDDWDLSGQITMFVVSETADMQSAKFALMYDAEALYASGVIRDPSPLMNRHDPKVDGDKGWDADACQFRFSLDPALGYPLNIGYGQGDMTNPNLVHLALWYYTDRQEPCLQMHSSMEYKSPRPEWGQFGVVPHDLYAAKYVKMADGGGYTFEYKIPWSTLGAKQPLKGGDLVAGTVQFCWSTPDGMHTAGGQAWAYDVMAGPGFPFQSTACWGKMIFSEKGNLPRELVEEGIPPAKPLPLKFAYDLPEDSQITIQLVDQDRMIRRILVAQGDRRAGKNVELWDGMDGQGQLLPAGTYAWQGIYHQPITTKFLFSPHNSGQPPYGTDDGTGGWGGDHGTPQAVCAFSGGVILGWNTAEAGWGIIRTNFQGKKQWGTRSYGATYLATDGKRIFAAGDEGFSATAGVRVLDINDARPLNFGNGLPQLSPPPGGEEKLNGATGVAYADGVIYVSYRGRNLVGLFDAESGALKTTWTMPAPGRLAARPGGGLAVISASQVVAVKEGQVTPLVKDHLEAPQGIAVGPDGTVYVANAGQLQNVSVFDANGIYQRSIGKAGGRPRVGLYDQGGILEPGEVSLDPTGQLWVAERLDYPKRISVWNSQTGAFVNEFFGGCSYFGYGWMDPRVPDEVYCHNVIWKIDWEHNTCQPYSTIWRQTGPNVMLPPGPAGYNEHPRFFTARNGRQYCYGNGPFCSILLMREGPIYKPLAAFITLSRGYVYFPGVQFALMEDEEKYPNGQYYWQDANNDQILQAPEIVRLPDDSRLGFGPLDPDLNVWMGTKIMRPVRVEADGRPVYDPSKLEDTVLAKTGHGGITDLDPDDGGLYTRDSWMAKWSAEGKLLWAFPGMKDWPSALAYPIQAPGRLWGLTNSLGVSGDFMGASCYFGTYHLFTRDGIYVGMLMRDGRDGKGMGPDLTASETLTGQIVKPDGMNRYFLIAGASDARFTEVFGLDTIKRLPGGTFTLSEADAKLAAEAQAEYAAQLARSKRLPIVRGLPALQVAEPVGKTLDAGRSFTCRLAYDERNLYVSYDVTSPYELVSTLPDPNLLFKGGNCLDVQIATDPAADPERKTPAPGDVRLLVTRRNDQLFTVLYRPKVKGFTGEPIVLTSPTGKESFDQIEMPGTIGLEYHKTAAGFTALVTIPQELIGLELQPGSELRLDLGYLYGNATGNQVSARSYWLNNSFSANVTNDVPTESRLEPAEWGTAIVE